jgi:outer membrane protein
MTTRTFLLSLTALLLPVFAMQIFAVDPGTPPSQKDPWVPPKGLVVKPLELPQSVPPPPDLMSRMTNLTLTDLIDLALVNSLATRESWYKARSAEAKMGQERADYYPQIGLELDSNYSKGTAVGGRFKFNQKTVTPTVTFDWTLMDFTRGADVQEQKQNLIAANWSHNSTIQNIVLQVEQAYYQYLNARALAAAEEATLKEAQTNLQASDERHNAGVATISDVLQARTQASQAQLALEGTRGQIQTVRGILATALGVPPNANFDTQAQLPEQLPLEQVAQNVEALIKEAWEKRPDLSSSRAEAEAAYAHTRSIKGEGWPTIQLTGQDQDVNYVDPSFRANNYSVGLFVRFPLFTGFRHTNDVREAAADAEAARSRTKALQQQVTLQVWTSYFDLKTASERVGTSNDLLASAQEAYDATFGRYRAGVGNIQELLSSQAALENARAQQIQAKTDWLLALAQLSHDTGTLWLSTEGAK